MADKFLNSLELCIKNEAQYSQEIPQILEIVQNYDKKQSWILSTLFSFIQKVLTNNPSKDINLKSLAIELLIDCICVKIVEVCSSLQTNSVLMDVIKKHINNSYKMNTKDPIFLQFNLQLKELIQILASKFPQIQKKPTSFKILYDELKAQGVEYPVEIIIEQRMCTNLQNAIEQAKKSKKGEAQQTPTKNVAATTTPQGSINENDIIQQIKQMENIYEGVRQFVIGAMQNSDPSEVNNNLLLYNTTIKNLDKTLEDTVNKILSLNNEKLTEKYLNDIFIKRDFINDYTEAYQQFQSNETAGGLKKFKSSLDKYLPHDLKAKMDEVRSSFEGFDKASPFQNAKQEKKQKFESFEPYDSQNFKTSQIQQKPFEFEQFPSQIQQQSQQQVTDAFGGFQSQIIEKQNSLGNSQMQFQFNFQEGSDQNSVIGEDKFEKKPQQFQKEMPQEIKEDDEKFVKQSMGFKDSFQQKSQVQRSSNFDDFGSPKQQNSPKQQAQKSTNFDDFGSFEKNQPKKQEKKVFGFGETAWEPEPPQQQVQKQPEWPNSTPQEPISFNVTPKQQKRQKSSEKQPNDSEFPDDFEERFSNASVSTISMMDVPMKNTLINLKPKKYGRTLEYNGTVFNDLLTKNPRDKNNRRFKLACLKDKSVLYESGGLQVGIQTSNFFDYMTSKNFLLMIIFFGNLSKSSDKTLHNLDSMYSGDYTFSLWASPETIEKPLRPNTQLKQELIINYNTLPFTQINCNLSYNDNSQNTRQIIIPLPALIPKFMVFKETNKMTFKHKWQLKKADVITSQFFKPNSHILRSSNALLRYVPKLIELTDYQQFLSQPKNSPHLQSYKLGGVFELNQPDIEYMIKISLKPNAVAFVQAVGFSSQMFVVEHIVQTFVFLLAAPGNDNLPIIMQPSVETISNDEKISGFQF